MCGLSFRGNILLHFAYDDLLQVAEFFFRNGLKVREQWFADDGDTREAVVQDLFVILGFRLRVDGNGHRADLDGSEKGVEKFRRVQQQKEDTLFGAHAERQKGIADAIGSFQQLLIGDPLVATFDSDLRAAAFLDVAIHKMRGDIEGFRQCDQVTRCLPPGSVENWDIL